MRGGLRPNAGRPRRRPRGRSRRRSRDVIVNAISDAIFCFAATFLDKLGKGF